MNHRPLCLGINVCAVFLCTVAQTQAALVTLWEHGPASNRVDIVFMGDGYTIEELNTTYASHVESTLAHLFGGSEDPFPRYAKFFNVHRLDIASEESGADHPINGVYHRTALDATYYGDGVTERTLQVNTVKALQVMQRGLVDTGITADVRLVPVNSTIYGGTGGIFATYSGGHVAAAEIALHELGHAFAGLADEYSYGGDRPSYAGPAPAAANVSISATNVPWEHWLGYEQPGMGVIGAYEGAYYHEQGVFRPSLDSKMRSLNRPFDAVAREQIILSIYEYVDPLDAWATNETVCDATLPLWVVPVDSAVIKLQWYVDGQLILGASDSIFRLADYGFGRGVYEVRLHAYDDTDWVRIQRDALQQNVYWSVVMVPEPRSGLLVGSGIIILGAMVARNGATPHRLRSAKR